MLLLDWMTVFAHKWHQKHSRDIRVCGLGIAKHRQLGLCVG